MKRLILSAAFAFLSVAMLFAQEAARFSVEVSNDSILIGNYFEVKFTLENARGSNFQAPEFEDFMIVGGPNMASSMHMMNGEVSQTVTYSFYLQPKEVGNYYIYPASIAVGEEVLESDPVELMVVPNPDGIKQEIPSSGGFQFRWDDSLGMPDAKPGEPKKEGEDGKPKKKKKKKKLYKL